MRGEWGRKRGAGSGEDGGRRTEDGGRKEAGVHRRRGIATVKERKTKSEPRITRMARIESLIPESRHPSSEHKSTIRDIRDIRGSQH